MIDIKVEDKGFTTRLIATVERLQNMKPAMEKIGKYVEGSVLRNFDSGGRPTQWKKNIWGTPVMMKTGATHRGIKIENVTEHSVEVVSNGGGNYHHNEHYTSNTPRAKRFFWAMFSETKLPQWKGLALSNKVVFIKPMRRFMMFQEQDKVEIKHILQTYLTKGE